MKNRIFCLIFGVVALLFTGCQSENEPIRLTNALAEMIFYGNEGEAVRDVIDMTAYELQDIFQSWTEIMLMSDLLPELPPAEDELDEDDYPYNTEDYDIFMDDEEPALVVPDLISAMATSFLQSAMDVTTFSTRLMTLSPTHAVIGISVSAMDMPSFFSEYFGLIISASSRSHEISDEEFLEEIFDDYMAIISNLQTTTTPTDIFIDLVRFEGEWVFLNPDVAITQLYSALTGSPLF